MVFPEVRPELAEFVHAFEAMGFKEVTAPRQHARDRFYRHSRSTSSAEYFAALGYKPKAMTYGLYLGVSVPSAMTILRRTLPTLLKYLQPAVAETGLLQRPCWTMFNAGRALNWDLMGIPAPIDPASWPRQLREAESKLLEPIFFSITNAKEVVGLLLRDDDPLVWWKASSAVLRTAEIIALSRVAGIDTVSVREKLAPFEDAIRRNMQGVKDPAAMIEDLARAMRTSH